MFTLSEKCDGRGLCVHIGKTDTEIRGILGHSHLKPSNTTTVI